MKVLYVYKTKTYGEQGLLKIGMTTREGLYKRMCEIRRHLPEEVDFVWVTDLPNGHKDISVHHLLRLKGVKQPKNSQEWFYCTLDDVQKAYDKLKYMTADEIKKEYYEKYYRSSEIKAYQRGYQKGLKRGKNDKKNTN